MTLGYRIKQPQGKIKTREPNKQSKEHIKINHSLYYFMLYKQTKLIPLQEANQ